jgi:NAD(P)-dependent dehydrogenase (short-subunit alcohol dehydrogenase family)
MTRHAVVTGAARGIGRGTVEHLLDAGWRVAALDVDEAALAAFAAAREGDPLLAVGCDVADEAQVAAVFGRIDTWCGEPGLALLFNNAGIKGAATGPVERLELAEWRRRVDASLTGTFLCVRAAVPALRRAKGAIVNMASTRAFQSEPHCEAYAAAKGGVVALSHALAVSLGPDVRVNAVAPGWIETRPDAVHDERERLQHPAGRVGMPADIAATVAWLADAGFVTGQTIVVDGGMSKRMIYEA